MGDIMENKIIQILDCLTTSTTKQHLDTAISTYTQPLLITSKQPNLITPLLTYIYEKYIRYYTHQNYEQSLPKLSNIPYIQPITDIEWVNKSSIYPDWGDLGLYLWHISGGHTVLIINLHHIKYNRFIYTLQVLELLTIGRAMSKCSLKHFAHNIIHIIVQHIECLPNDKAGLLINIIESTFGISRFRYYLFGHNQHNWDANLYKKLRGLCWQIPVTMSISNLRMECVGYDDIIYLDIWKALYKYLACDILKTMILFDNMVCNNKPNDKINVEEYVYTYLTKISPLFTCLDKFFSKTIFIRQLNNNGIKKHKMDDYEKVFQTPIQLANNLIGSCYTIYTITTTCNIIAQWYANLEKITTANVMEIIKYGAILSKASLAIDKPVMALVDYFQKIITLFSDL